MTKLASPFRPLRLAGPGLVAVLAAGLLAGCSSGAPHPGKFARNAEHALQGGQVDKAVTLAERAVAADGRNPAYRLLLGNAYLRAGRFDSARAAYDDAMELGEDGGKAALSLALAQVALGRGAEAVDTLNTYSDAIPPADLGLALALAGQTGRGARLLTDVLRGGENTPKVRQNLALAYALDGSWREAAIMAEQDVPADQIDARIKGWAALAGPEKAQLRVASVLGTPVRNDPGQPAALALANFPVPAPALAQSATPVAAAAGSAAPAGAAPADTAPADTAKAAALAQAAVGELPPLPSPATPAPALADASSVAPRAQLAAVALPPARTAPASAAPAPAAAPARPAPAAPVAAPVAASVERSTHVVQLGAFGTPGGARRAWRHFVARDPGLAGYRSIITRAVVHGREFWRVQAGGFAGFASARTVCGAVKARGGVCLVMAAAHPQQAPAVAGPAPARLARSR